MTSGYTQLPGGMRALSLISRAPKKSAAIAAPWAMIIR